MDKIHKIPTGGYVDLNDNKLIAIRDEEAILNSEDSKILFKFIGSLKDLALPKIDIKNIKLENVIPDLKSTKTL